MKKDKDDSSIENYHQGTSSFIKRVIKKLEGPKKLKFKAERSNSILTNEKETFKSNFEF